MSGPHEPEHPPPGARRREALKRVAVALRGGGVGFALAGGYAGWALGGPEPEKDVDFVVTEPEAEKAVTVLVEAGLDVHHPPEDWLFKVYSDGALVDILFRLAGESVDQELLGRATEQEVLSVPMPVVSATDLIIGKLAALNEHACDLAKVLPTARALREKIDWERAEDETAWNDIAVACLFLLRRIDVAPERSDAGGREDEPVSDLRRVTATRYVTPLREGGSLPGLVEADDLGTYVAKFTGAGQGLTALVAEIVAGEIARRLGLRVPELVVLDLDPVIARAEPDWEVQELLARSGGANLGMDFLPGAIGFDPVAHAVDPVEASRVLWFDAYVENVDRSWRNPNLLCWHRELWLIDHGACLYFHHSWARAASVVARPYDLTDHVLAPAATARAEADAELGERVDEALLTEAAARIPDEWLDGTATRENYVEHLLARLAAREAWVPR